MDLTPTGSPQVELKLPADNAYAAVLRMTATGLAARAEFTVDAIEDLRISVGEAIALLIPLASEGTSLETTFTVHPGRILVAMATTTTDGTEVDESSFAWQVLSTLAADCRAVHTADRIRVEFEVTSATTES